MDCRLAVRGTGAIDYMDTHLVTALATDLPTVSICTIQRPRGNSFDITSSFTAAAARFQARLVMCFACFLCVAALRLLPSPACRGIASGAAGLKAVRLPRLSLLGRLFEDGGRPRSAAEKRPGRPALCAWRNNLASTVLKPGLPCMPDLAAGSFRYLSHRRA